MYSFISNDVDVYTVDNDNQNHFVITKLLCSKCHNYWHTSLMECFFCGELNYYLYSCTSCGKKYSITNASIKCVCQDPESKLIKACVNSECPTNTETNIIKLASGQGGVFDLKSSLTLSLNYCVKCGNISNYYYSWFALPDYRIFPNSGRGAFLRSEPLEGLLFEGGLFEGGTC